MVAHVGRKLKIKYVSAGSKNSLQQKLLCLCNLHLLLEVCILILYLLTTKIIKGIDVGLCELLMSVDLWKVFQVAVRTLSIIWPLYIKVYPGSQVVLATAREVII